MTTVVYPFDPQGSNPANKIENEQQVLTPVNGRDHHFIVPDCAPFFVDTVVMEYRTTNGTLVPLTEGVDYYYTHHYISASRACAKPIAGSIEFLNKNLQGVVRLAYQTIGGIWTANEQQIAELLANKLRNPRITSWEQVIDQPATFPVIDHEWNLVDMVGAKEVVEAIDGVTAAVLTSIQNQAEHLKVTGGYVSSPDGGRVALGGNGVSSGNQFGGAVEISSPGASASQSILRHSADAVGPTMRLMKTRGANRGDRNSVLNGDVLGAFTAEGADGDQIVPGFKFEATVDGLPNLGHIPTKLTLWIDNGTNFVPRLVIGKDGSIRQTDGSAVVGTNNVAVVDDTVAQTFSSLLGWLWKKANDVIAVLTPSGRLGIGTDTPLFGLHLVSANSPTVYVESGTNQGGGFRAKNQLSEYSMGIDATAATGDWVLRDVGNNQIAYRYRSGNAAQSGHRWSIQNVNVMSLDQEGLLNLGLTVPWAAFKARLNASFDGSSTAGISIRNSSASGKAVVFTQGGTVGAAAPTEIGSISVTTSATSYNTASDRRLKTNIVPSSEVGHIIDQINIVDHEFLTDPGNVVKGVIAQDLNQVYPQAVTPGDIDDDGVIDKTWSVDLSKLVPLLVREVQSIRRRLDDAERENQQLKEQVSSLKQGNQ